MSRDLDLDVTEDELRMSAPTPPPVGEFEAIPDPFDCVAALNRLADVMGWRFPRRHAALRKAKLRQIRDTPKPDGSRYTFAEIGELIDLHATRVWQLLAKNKSRPDAVAPDLAEECAPAVVLPTTPARSRKTAAAGDFQTIPAEATS